MVKLEYWSFRECVVPLHYHYSQVHPVIVPTRVPSMSQIELFNHLSRIIFTPRVFQASLLIITIIIIIIIIIDSFESFHPSVTWWFSAGIWVTASPLAFPGLFLVFWLICNAVVWMVSAHPRISKSSSPCANPLVIIIIIIIIIRSSSSIILLLASFSHQR